MKRILVFLLLLCCVGCGLENSQKKIDDSAKSFNETIYGHKDNEEAMTSNEAYSLVNDTFGSLYDSIEYYDMVKYATGDVLNDFYAFFVTKDDDSYYILVDIYNGVTTFVTADDLNIEK